MGERSGKLAVLGNAHQFVMWSWLRPPPDLADIPVRALGKRRKAGAGLFLFWPGQSVNLVHFLVLIARPDPDFSRDMGEVSEEIFSRVGWSQRENKKYIPRYFYRRDANLHPFCCTAAFSMRFLKSLPISVLSKQRPSPPRLGP
jgi:hypothetical protein